MLSEDADTHVNFVMKHKPITDMIFSEIMSHTLKNEQLKYLKDLIVSGWPLKRNLCPTLHIIRLSELQRVVVSLKWHDIMKDQK